MRCEVEQAAEILRRTPHVLRALLSDLSPPWIERNYGPDTWSPFDIVGHLIHGERTDWIARARIMLEHGPDRPFDPFDRFAQERESRGKTMADLLDEFQTLRGRNVETLEGWALTEDDLQRRGTHPALGEVTLRQLIATWTTHDLHHIAQIGKCMARQYADEVGVWREYITILD